MRTFSRAWIVVLASLGCNGNVAGADQPHGQVGAARSRTARIHHLDRDDAQPVRAVADVKATELCVTRGNFADTKIDVPTFRAVALGKSGDAAAVSVVVHGETTNVRALSSGEERHQLGVKLRAQDGCNLVYVMWRLDPKPKIAVSVKLNPGMATAQECGANGYTNVKPAWSASAADLPILDDGKPHSLRAEISGDALTAWVDGTVAWQGTLPESARDLAGPAGVRSDNLSFDLTGFAVDSRQNPAATVKKLKCTGDAGD